MTDIEIVNFVSEIVYTKLKRRIPREDVEQTTWEALLVAKTRGGELVKSTTEIAVALLRSARDDVFDALRRVEFHDENFEKPAVNNLGVDVASVLRSTFRKLDGRDVRFFIRYYLRGEKMVAIAADSGVSSATVSNRVGYAAAVFLREYNRANQQSRVCQ